MTTDDIPGRSSRRMAAPGWKQDHSIGFPAPEAEHPVRPVPLSRGHLEIANVGFVENKRVVLDDLSFELEPGSTGYLVSSTPEERSALLTLLLGLQAPSKGTIRLDGALLADLPPAERRSAVTVALADPWLVAGTIAENIAFGLTALDREQITQAAKLACVDVFTAKLEHGLDTIVSEEAPELSAGQRRLVGLARAVVRQPAVLLVEEPTRDLDAQAETLAIRAVQRVSEGRTTLVAAPRRHLVRQADRIVRLESGRLAAPSADCHTRAPDTDWARSRDLRRLDSAQSVLAIETGHELVDGFRAIGLVDRSPHTETWLAWDMTETQMVNVKLPRRLPTTYVALEELTREFRTSELLSHPGLARPLNAEFGHSRPHAVYEHLEGRTLADLIGTRIDVHDPELVLRIGYELARTLTYIHQQGFAHLDLRPEIVVVSPQGTIITDLKMALRLGDEQVRFYRRDQFGVLAAEQLRGGPAAASMDMFALGALLYQAANGVLATDSSCSFGAERHSIGTRPPRRRPNGQHQLLGAADRGGDLSTAVASVIELLTASDPSQRPTAEETIALIRPYLLPVPLSSGSTVQPKTTWSSATSHQAAS